MNLTKSIESGTFSQVATIKMKRLAQNQEREIWGKIRISIYLSPSLFLVYILHEEVILINPIPFLWKVSL